MGSLAEAVDGRQPQVWIASAKEQVIAVVGKRGSGKSFTLGVLIEGLTCGPGSDISRQSLPRAVVVFDPLDIYWTTRYSVASNSNAEAERHYQLARKAGLTELSFDVSAWIPGSENRRATDPTWFNTLQLQPAAMELEEWEILLGINLITEPMGHALVDSLRLARSNGYTVSGEVHPPTSTFGLTDVIQALGSSELDGVYHAETLRALRQRLSGLEASGLFSAEGTSIRELLVPGRASVIMLSRLPQSHRDAVVAMLTRMVISIRSETAFAEKRLTLDPDLTAEEREDLEAIARDGAPRTTIVLDEAQSFLAPGRSSTALDLFVRVVKEGRNMGLSAILATQQPSALDKRILSQVETFVTHQLVTEPDIRAVRDNLKADLPESISSGGRKLEPAGLLREVSPGICMVSAADMNTTVRRSVVVSVRPRATVHGGIEL